MYISIYANFKIHFWHKYKTWLNQVFLVFIEKFISYRLRNIKAIKTVIVKILKT